MTIFLVVVVIILAFFGYTSTSNILNRLHEAEDDMEYQRMVIRHLENDILLLNTHVHGLEAREEERKRNEQPDRTM